MIKRFTWLLLCCMLVVALLVTSCGDAVTDEEEEVNGEEEEVNGEEEEGPKYGGTLRVAYTPDQFSLDPPLLSGAADILVVHQCYESLTERNPDWTLRPLLAKSWDANDDLTQWTFELEQGVKFSHGKEMTSEDVVYSFDRLFEVESPFASVISMVEDIVAVDDYTVRFDLSSATAFLPDLISRYHCKITPSDIDPERLATETFGTGPFIVTEHVIGERTVMEKNPDYWWDGYPYLDEVIFIYFADPETRAEALKAGTVDAIMNMAIPSIQTIEADPNCKVSLIPSAMQMNMLFNVNEPPFDNILVRKAIQAATDRQAILDGALFGNGGIAYDHCIVPTDPHFNEDCMPPEYNIELAKDLLEQAGYDDGIDITLYTSTLGPPLVEMATVMKEKAEPAGIRIDVQVMPEAGYWSDVWMVKPFCCSYWGGRIPDEAFSMQFLSTADWNETGYVNTRVDELIIQARSQLELADRQESYGEAQCIIIDEVPKIIPVFMPILHGMRNNIMGLEAKPHGDPWCRYIWLDN
ncbi:MAG: ABC transporter substrate-binding protein [Dehalococcoidales bacterium]|nr:MAG: ABC transporter substrate-binding protein [Dehalococcoidales bacterium]